MATVSFHHAYAALFSLAQRGESIDELLQQVGINPQLAAQRHSRIHDWQMTHIVQLVWQKLADEFMGFTPNKCPPGAFAFMLKTVAKSPNLKDALKTGMQFYNLLSQDIQTQLICDNDSAIIDIQFLSYEQDPAHFFLEFWLVIWHRVASWLCGIQLPLINAKFNFSKPQHHQELTLMFPCQHQFSQQYNQLTFSTEYLTAKPIRDKAEVMQFLQRSPYDLLTIPGHDLSLRRQVTDFLNQQLQSQLSMATLSNTASYLSLTEATLHRRLQAEGVSFQQIKDDVRRDMAIQLLVKDKRSVAQISELIGFNDARSFTRAFKKWTGLSPRDYCRFAK